MPLTVDPVHGQGHCSDVRGLLHSEPAAIGYGCYERVQVRWQYVADHRLDRFRQMLTTAAAAGTAGDQIGDYARARSHRRSSAYTWRRDTPDHLPPRPRHVPHHVAARDNQMSTLACFGP